MSHWVLSSPSGDLVLFDSRGSLFQVDSFGGLIETVPLVGQVAVEHQDWNLGQYSVEVEKIDWTEKKI